MIVEKSFKKAKLFHQANDSQLVLEIIPHPVISGCCILTILEDDNKIIRQSITINKSELKEAGKIINE